MPTSSPKTRKLKRKKKMKMKEVKNMNWHELQENELGKALKFIQASLKKDSTIKALFMNLWGTLKDSSITMRIYIPTLGMNVLFATKHLLSFLYAIGMIDNAPHQPTKVSVGLPRGYMGADESNAFMLELATRDQARSIAKDYSQYDVVVIGLDVKGQTINVHVAYKDEIEAYKEEVENKGGSRIDFLPITSKFLTRLMGYAA